MDPALHNGPRALLRANACPQCIGYAVLSLAGGVVSNLFVAGVLGSVTRVSAGLVTVTFSSPQPDGNYAVAGMPSGDGVTARQFWLTTVAPTPASFQVQVTSVTGAANDCNNLHIIVFR